MTIPIQKIEGRKSKVQERLITEAANICKIEIKRDMSDWTGSYQNRQGSGDQKIERWHVRGQCDARSDARLQGESTSRGEKPEGPSDRRES